MLRLLPLLLASAIPAQSIGTTYGVGTPDFANGCGTLVWHAENIYAIGSARIGGSFDFTTVRRDWCSKDQLLHLVAIGTAQASTPLPASFTNTHDSTLLVAPTLIAIGQPHQTVGMGSHVVVKQTIPNNPSLVGVTLYSQWALYWFDVAAERTRMMLSKGLAVTITN